MTLVIANPLWFILICILIGAAGTFILYYFNKKTELSARVRYLLMVLRFLSLFLISFLLLSPLIRQNIEIIEKPLIVLGIDNSESIVLTADSEYYKKEFPGKISNLIQILQESFDVKAYSLDETVEPLNSLTFKGKQTNLSLFFKEIEERYVNRNVGAVVLISDGIYNKGIDPFYASRKLPFNIYCIPLGDTVQHQDIFLRKITYNSTAFIGDQFPVEILYSAYFCQGKRTRLTFSQGAKIIFTKEIIPSEEEFTDDVKILIDAKTEGNQIFNVKITPIEGEISKTNNQKQIVVKVLNSREKIAILYNAPHPDIAAIEKALMKTGKYEINTFSANTFTDSPRKYGVFVFHQLPSLQSTANLNPILTSSVPGLFILGTQSDLTSFNKLNTGLIINSPRPDCFEAVPVFNENFSLFNIDSRLASAISLFPPLMSPLGTYQSGPLSDILCFQKIGSATTRIPQFIFCSQPDRKIGIIAGENLWKWRMSDYIAHSNADAFDELINKTIQLLSVKADKSFFRVKVNDPAGENEGLKFQAELYNDAYELINDPDVNIVLTDSNQKNYSYVFNRTLKAYELKAGIFPAGTYKYDASVNLGNKQYRKTGNVSVIPVNSEAVNLVADHHLLFRIADAHAGTVVSQLKPEDLANLLKKREDIHSISNIQKRFTDLIGNPWLFAAILLLLTIEWTIRKRNGL